MTRHRTIAAALILLAAAGLSSESAAQCVSSNKGQEMVNSRQVKTLIEALQLAGISPNQLVDQPQLCNAGGWVYRVTIVRSGQRTTVDIPAS